MIPNESNTLFTYFFTSAFDLFLLEYHHYNGYEFFIIIVIFFEIKLWQLIFCTLIFHSSRTLLNKLQLFLIFDYNQRLITKRIMNDFKNAIITVKLCSSNNGNHSIRLSRLAFIIFFSRSYKRLKF